MSHPADDRRPEDFDAFAGDGTSSPSSDWRNDPSPGTDQAGAPYGANPYLADPLGNQQFGTQQYEAQQYGAQQYGAQPFGNQPFGNQQYGTQQYGAQPYGGQPLTGPGFAAPGYGTPAYGAVQPYGQYPQVARKDPAIMLVASLIIPGLGTLLNGSTGKGIGIFAGYCIGALLSVILIGLPIMFGFWVWGMVDAYNGAKDFNARHGLP